MRKEKITKRPVIEVAAALIERDGQFLITQRRPDVHYGMFWEFPGGKREIGESPEECLKREIYEELNLIVEVNELWGKYCYEYTDRQVILYFYRCGIVSGEPLAKEVLNFKWIKSGEMNYDHFPPADVEIIKRLKIEV